MIVVISPPSLRRAPLSVREAQQPRKQSSNPHPPWSTKAEEQVMFLLVIGPAGGQVISPVFCIGGLQVRRAFRLVTMLAKKAICHLIWHPMIAKAFEFSCFTRCSKSLRGCIPNIMSVRFALDGILVSGWQIRFLNPQETKSKSGVVCRQLVEYPVFCARSYGIHW